MADLSRKKERNVINNYSTSDSYSWGFFNCWLGLTAHSRVGHL